MFPPRGVLLSSDQDPFLQAWKPSSLPLRLCSSEYAFGDGLGHSEHRGHRAGAGDGHGHPEPDSGATAPGIQPTRRVQEGALRAFVCTQGARRTTRRDALLCILILQCKKILKTSKRRSFSPPRAYPNSLWVTCLS